MTSDEYVFQVLQKYQDSKNEILQVETLANNIAKDLTVWANDCLGNISFSGAFAKGTTIKGSSDVGLFIHLIRKRISAAF